MAAANFLTVNQNEPLGMLAIQIHDLLLQVVAKSTELDEALGQAAADDNIRLSARRCLAQPARMMPAR